VAQTGPTDTIFENAGWPTLSTIDTITIANMTMITAPATSKIWERLLRGDLLVLEPVDSDDSLELNDYFNYQHYLLIFKLNVAQL
jgi:hypothetical protein